MRHKLMSVMVEREGSRKMDGRVEKDDMVLGGEKSEADGGKRGRSGPNKPPFVVAVETSDDGRPLRLSALRAGGKRDARHTART